MNINIPDIGSKLGGLTSNITGALTSQLGSFDVKGIISDKVGGIATKYKDQITSGLTGKLSEMTQFSNLSDFNLGEGLDLSSITSGSGLDMDLNSKMQEMLNSMDISNF